MAHAIIAHPGTTGPPDPGPAPVLELEVRLAAVQARGACLEVDGSYDLIRALRIIQSA